MRTYLLSLLDRVARTAVQSAAGLLVASHGTVNWKVIVLGTALTVAVSVLQGLIDFPAIPGGWLGDVAGRALRTFAQTAVGSIGAAALVTDVSWSTLLTAAVLAAAASVMTSGIATPLGAVKGTPDLVDSGHAYVGYPTAPRHLRVSRHVATAFVATSTAAVAFAGIATVGVVSAHNAPIRILAAPAPPPTQAVPSVPPPPPDKSPAYFTALNRASISTAASDHAALLEIANSICNTRTTVNDLQQANQIVAAHPGKWTQQQATTIVDVAIDSYCQ